MKRPILSVNVTANNILMISRSLHPLVRWLENRGCRTLKKKQRAQREKLIA